MPIHNTGQHDAGFKQGILTLTDWCDTGNFCATNIQTTNELVLFQQIACLKKPGNAYKNIKIIVLYTVQYNNINFAALEC
jgi:hypothetical protein